jgi:hypothetical protein
MASIISKHILQIHNLRSILEQGQLGSLAAELKKNQLAIVQTATTCRLAFRDNSGIFHDVIDTANLLPFTNNAAAIAGGLNIGDPYRTGGDPDYVCVVHTPVATTTAEPTTAEPTTTTTAEPVIPDFSWDVSELP